MKFSPTNASKAVSGSSFEKSNRVTMVNIFAMMATLATFSYLFVYEGLFFYLNIFFMFGFSATMLFNTIGRTRFAKLWLYTLIHLAIFLSASAFGRAAGEQLILLPVLFGGVLVFHSREKWSMMFAISLTLMTLLILEWTEYSILTQSISPQIQLKYYYGNLSVAVVASTIAALFHRRLYNNQLHKTREMISVSLEIEDTINYFSTSLFGQNTVEEILWDVAKNCISRLGFEDCVIYLVDSDNNVLVQKAAFGAKNPVAFKIKNPLEIPIGEGIVGHVAKFGTPQLVEDTTLDSRYIEDDIFRFSELAVPLIYNDTVIGVIDSEHSKKNFFTKRHLRLLQTIAALCANKVIRAQAEADAEKTKLLQIEAEKIKAIDDLKTKLLTNISHELRTPLTLIKGTIDNHLPAADNSDWAILNTHTNRLLRLINQLLDLTRLESGQFLLHPEPGDISAFFKMSVALFTPMAATKNVSIDHEGLLTPLYLNFDRDALEKIFYNILSNAVKFTREGTIIRIHTSYAKGSLRVQVSDQGPGIPKTEHKSIFERFYQSGNDRSGTGIGLAITRELVELHQGHISLQSSEKFGSIFELKIPLHRSDKELISSSKSTDSTRKPTTEKAIYIKNKPQLLLIEDNVEVADLLVRLLKEKYHVHLAYEGNSGIQQAKDLIPDLIISDVMMPGISGLELTRKIKTDPLTNHIPVILLTARADMESKLKGLHTGADDYLVKPFHSKELLSRIKNLLRQRVLLREKFKKIIELHPRKTSTLSGEENFLLRLMEVMEQRFHESEFGVRELAREMNMSRMQVHRKITALLGLSANKFMREFRLEKAAQLLAKGEMVSQAAYSVGYSSLSNFSKIFKAKFGVSPSEYNSNSGS